VPPIVGKKNKDRTIPYRYLCLAAKPQFVITAFTNFIFIFCFERYLIMSFFKCQIIIQECDNFYLIACYLYFILPYAITFRESSRTTKIIIKTFVPSVIKTMPLIMDNQIMWYNTLWNRGMRKLNCFLKNSPTVLQ
jgi:hypothetical protein